MSDYPWPRLNMEPGGCKVVDPAQQKSCLGLPRHYAPPEIIEPPPPDFEPIRDDIIGAHFNFNRRKYKVEFWYLGEKHYVGIFRRAEDAARAYNEYVLQHGMNRPLNPIGDAHEE